ncbi:MAG: beta-propeller fold lactonase family protein [Candidatus Dormiibacterota bacterium]
MKNLLRLGTTVAFLASCATLLNLPVSAADPGQPSWGGGQHLVFAQTNGAGGNQVIVYRHTAEGPILVGRYLTGGVGATASAAVVDSLASQGSLVFDPGHQVLISVNAGSDSISVFQVGGGGIALRQVLSSAGSFPDSIAVSGQLVYVLNGGGVGVLQGYHFDGDRLRPIPGSARSLGLTNTDPPNYLESPGQVGFTPNGRQLVVTTKASGSDIDVFTVAANGQLGAPTVNPSAQPVPFGFTFDNFGHLVVTEAGSSSVTTYNLSPGGGLIAIATLGDGQAALCWITRVDGFYYGANAGSNSLSGYTVGFNGSLALLGPDGGVLANTDAGPIDMAVGSDGVLYAEAGGAGAIDEFQINRNGSLTAIGSVTGLGAGIEGIAVS